MGEFHLKILSNLAILKTKNVTENRQTVSQVIENKLRQRKIDIQ